MVLSVTGNTAACEIASPASMLKRIRADTEVIMAKNATKFISLVTFESPTGKKCLAKTFDRDFEFSVEHVALIKRTDVFLIALASANVIGKVSHGIANDMLTTTFLACGRHKTIALIINTHMHENPILQDNLKRCGSYRMEVLEPAVGYLVCGDTGTGEIPEPEVLFDYIVRAVDYEKDMAGKKVLATAGSTRKIINSVRFITDHSTRKIGYAVAKIASLRGADVILVSGLVPTEAPRSVKMVPVESARQMYGMVTAVGGKQDIIVKAVAAADHRPAQAADEKMKKKDGELSIDLCRTDDILGHLGSYKRDGQFLREFSVGAQNMLENSRMKLSRKHLDMIVADDLKADGAGFETDTNVVTTITGDGELELEKMSKEEVVGRLLDEIMKRTAGPT